VEAFWKHQVETDGKIGVSRRAQGRRLPCKSGSFTEAGKQPETGKMDFTRERLVVRNHPCPSDETRPSFIKAKLRGMRRLLVIGRSGVVA
jgi:hypothetical protein